MNILEKEKTQSQKGFTIIEVVLVLAIAGLIFLMVFIALPALQSSQRDTARKSDIGSISSAITSYTGNNRGSFPTTLALTGDSNGNPNSSGKFAGYISSVSNNMTNVIVVPAKTSQAVTQGQVVVVQGSKCGTSGAASGGTATETLTAGTTRQYAIVTYLEAGGGTSFCQDS